MAKVNKDLLKQIAESAAKRAPIKIEPKPKAPKPKKIDMKVKTPLKNADRIGKQPQGKAASRIPMATPAQVAKTAKMTMKQQAPTKSMEVGKGKSGKASRIPMATKTQAAKVAPAKVAAKTQDKGKAKGKER